MGTGSVPYPLRLVLAISHWAPLFDGLVFMGDNVASLQLALSGRARGPMGLLARELFLRQVKHEWFYGVSHLPSEENKLADFCSRLAQPGHDDRCPEALIGAAEVQFPRLSEFWNL